MTTPNSAANGGQILTDERIKEISATTFVQVQAMPDDEVSGDTWDRCFARAIEADLRAALATPASTQPDTQVAPLLGFLKSPEGKEAIASWRKHNATPATVKTAEPDDESRDDEDWFFHPND